MPSQTHCRSQSPNAVRFVNQPALALDFAGKLIAGVAIGFGIAGPDGIGGLVQPISVHPVYIRQDR